jgi:D-alanyl-D-alanine carboxypeptidase/D-alanyl-D-alanine-endopeptidase (penicillin-binding protein 4)
MVRALLCGAGCGLALGSASAQAGVRHRPGPLASSHAALPTDFIHALAQAGVPRSAVSVMVTPLPPVAPLADAPSPSSGAAAAALLAGGAAPAPAPISGKATANSKAKPKAPSKAQQTTPPAPRLSYRANALMNPASVMKLVTTYAALDMLGPDFTWANRVYVDGDVRDGVLTGNLVLRGGGDPKLVLERLDALLHQIQAQGVREVRGDIVLDHSVFDLPEHPAAFDDEPLRPYNVMPDGLLINFKSLIFHFSPDAAHARATLRSEPPIAEVDIPTSVPLGNGPCDDWRATLQADFAQPQQVRFAGNYPAACGDQSWPMAYTEPHSYARRVVQAMWAAAGGRLTGQVRDGTTPAEAQLLLSANSLPLAELVADINKFSNNVMAQQVFLTLSSQAKAQNQNQNQAHGSFTASRALLHHWWHTRIGQQTAPVLDNGSGLSRQERISAAALTALLRYADGGPLAGPFQASLGIAGVDGTVARLRERKPKSPALGRAWLKTGTLRDVVALAGYAQGLSGQRYTLVVLVNHEHAAAARPALDELLEWVVQDL